MITIKKRTTYKIISDAVGKEITVHLGDSVQICGNNFTLWGIIKDINPTQIFLKEVKGINDVISINIKDIERIYLNQ